MSRYLNHFYLDTEKDIVVSLFLEDDKLTYLLETPNHHTGNLITNLAKLTNLPITYNEIRRKIIVGEVPEYLDGHNQPVYIFKLADITVAYIYPDGSVELLAYIPAISKTLMSQTKNYNLSLQQTIIQSFIKKDCKFTTDLHTHMNANLNPDVLIALGIKHQIRYPLYYIKKLNLKITPKMRVFLERQRARVEIDFIDSPLVGKYLTRRIDDNTFINFASLILDNIQDAAYNISQIRTSLTILKDGQAVFTNLEKLYLYRYVFTKGVEDKNRIELTNIDELPDEEIRNYLYIMLQDLNNPNYKDNTIFMDKLLWVSREYQRQGINYIEISDTSLVKPVESVITLSQAAKILPLAEEETGVSIRFLAAIRRIPLTLVKDSITPNDYLTENLNVLSVVRKNPYVVGSDFVGEEINDISQLKDVIKKLVEFCDDDPSFTIRIHAGENDSLRNNVTKAIMIVKECLKEGQPFPKVRIGHGLHTPDLHTTQGRKLIKELKENNVILEFQLTSNIRLNNLNSLDKHPLRTYLTNGVRCVQGSDGIGIYGNNKIDEQLALETLLGLTTEELLKIVHIEKMILLSRKESFRKKCEENYQYLDPAYLTSQINKAILNKNILNLSIRKYLDAETIFEKRVKPITLDKIPIVVVGGSFNTISRNTKLCEKGTNIIDKLLTLDPKKYCFIIGHHFSGYEKYLVDNNHDFEIFAFLPSLITKSIKEKLAKEKVYFRISNQPEGTGIYKSINYEIFERRESIVVALDGNSPAANLIQEAKNGKAKASILINVQSPVLKEKADSLLGYVIPFKLDDDILEFIER